MLKWYMVVIVCGVVAGYYGSPSGSWHLAKQEIKIDGSPPAVNSLQNISICSEDQCQPPRE